MKVRNPRMIHGDEKLALTIPEQREIDSLKRMLPHERMYTVRGEGYDYLKPYAGPDGKPAADQWLQLHPKDTETMQKMQQWM